MTNQLKKKCHTAEFKFKVALEGIRREKTTGELCQEFGIVSSQLFAWKKAVLENGQDIFKNGLSQKDSQEKEIEKLHATIGKLKVENDFLEKCARRFRL